MRPFVDKMFRELRRACLSTDARTDSPDEMRSAYVESAHCTRLTEQDIEATLKARTTRP
jgi:hypothetical protein